MACKVPTRDHKRKRGTLKARERKDLKSRKQAIAIGLSEARKRGQEGAEKEEKILS